MQHAIAPWRVTYTPGNWLVLSGPSSLVVMVPAPARMSALINRLWTDIVQARSLDALLELLATYGFDAMPDLAAFFWDEEGLHGIARGAVRVVDTQAGEVAFDGEGVKTWREVALGEERQLRIDMEPVDQDAVLQLPLVVGAASASAIYLNTHSEARLRFPDEESLGAAAAPEPARAVETPEDEGLNAPTQIQEVKSDDIPDGPVPVPSAEPSPTQPSAAEPEPVVSGTDLEVAPEPEPWVDAEVVSESDAPAAATEPAAVLPPEPTPEIASPEPQATAQPEPQASAEGDVPVPPPSPQPEPVPDLQPVPSADDPDAIGTGQLDFDTGEVHVGAAAAAAGPVAPSAPPAAPPGVQPTAEPPYEPAPQPASQPSAGGERTDPVVVPGRFAQQEEPADEGTIFSTNIAATHKPGTEPDPEPDPQVLTVWCPRRHPNAPGSVQCRICQAPVDSANPQLTRRPVLAGVNTNYGEFADIVDGVLVGRAPDAAKAPGAYLMRVNSPSSDISRSHLLVTTQGWNVIVTDLHSTNGTTVMPQGEQPFVLANGQSVQVELGTILDLGDGVSLRIEPPRGA